MKMPTVFRYVAPETEEGWFAENGKGEVAGPFQTNAEAWRWLERQVGEPVSPSEDRHQFGWDKFVNGE